MKRVLQRVARTILTLPRAIRQSITTPSCSPTLRLPCPELQLVDEPLLIAEDFAFYQRHLPGVFFFLLGTGVPEARKPDRRRRLLSLCDERPSHRYHAL